MPKDSTTGVSEKPTADSGNSFVEGRNAQMEGGMEMQIANTDSANSGEKGRKIQNVPTKGDKEAIIPRTEEQRKRWHELDSIEHAKWRTMPPPQWRGVAQPKTTPVDSTDNK